MVGKLTPDFKTIADFRRDNLSALKRVCREFTLLCRKLSLFGGDLVAIDGSKFKAVNNRKRNFSDIRLKKAIGAIDEKIGAYLASLDEQDRTEAPLADPTKLKAEELREKIKTLEERKEKYRKLKEELAESGEKQISLTDPVRARPDMMKQRQRIVEHPFGTIKRAMNQDYFLMRGLKKVGAEMSLTVLGYNIKRAITIIGVKKMIEAVT